MMIIMSKYIVIAYIVGSIFIPIKTKEVVDGGISMIHNTMYSMIVQSANANDSHSHR